MRGLEKVEVLAYDGGVMRVVSEDVIAETSLEIYLNDRRIVTLSCTGNHCEELAVGFLRSEGLIASKEDVGNIDVREEDGRAYVRISGRTLRGVPQGPQETTIASSGARGIGSSSLRLPVMTDSGPLVSVVQALKLMDDLLDLALLHEASHGTHCSALAGIDGILAAREDIGRHNTIDMLGGYALLREIDCTGKIILTTGRISSEIVAKVWTMGISVIISHSAPTSKACRLLAEAGITLIGYVRGGTMKIYSGQQRVTI